MRGMHAIPTNKTGPRGQWKRTQQKRKYQKRERGKKTRAKGEKKKTEMRNTTRRRGIENVGDERKTWRRRERKKNKRRERKVDKNDHTGAKKKRKKKKTQNTITWFRTLHKTCREPYSEGYISASTSKIENILGINCPWMRKALIYPKCKM
jgi:hypothetical protein